MLLVSCKTGNCLVSLSIVVVLITTTPEPKLIVALPLILTSPLANIVVVAGIVTLPM